MDGGTTFYFVSDGIESALTQAKDAAQGGDVWLAGGASVVNQYLAARLVDELDIPIRARGPRRRRAPIRGGRPRDARAQSNLGR